MKETEMLEYLSSRFDRDNPFSLEDHLIGLSVVGSRGYNLHTEDSDYDLLGVVAPPQKYVYGLSTWEHWHPKSGTLDHDLDVKLYSVEKFIRLLLKGNPNVLEYLWLHPSSRFVHSLQMDMIVQERDAFLSQNLWKAMRGTINGMRSRLDGTGSTRNLGERRKQWIEEYGYNPKDAYRMAHIVNMAGHVLAHGDLPVHLERGSVVHQTLMAMKSGDWSLPEVLRYVDMKEALAEQLYEVTSLPERPNFERAEKLLMQIHRQRWDIEDSR